MEIRTLGSRDVELFLSAFHDIADDQMSAYAGRLKHVARQGFPPGVGAGRGKPARYDADQFFQFLTVAELAQFGVTPARAIQLVSEAWSRLRTDVLNIWTSLADAEHGKIVETPSIFWSVPAQAQRHCARANMPYSLDADDVLRPVTVDQVQDALISGRYNVRRHAFIAAHQLVEDALSNLRFGHLSWPPEHIAAFMHGLRR